MDSGSEPGVCGNAYRYLCYWLGRGCHIIKSTLIPIDTCKFIPNEIIISRKICNTNLVTSIGVRLNLGSIASRVSFPYYKC